MGSASSIAIAGRDIGPAHRPFVIAEVGQAHDGSLGAAHAYIDAIADAGADAVKFQTHIAHAESTPSEPWRVKFGYQDATRYAYWKRMELSPEHWAGLAEHARERGLVFLSSPFSGAAVELLERLEVPAYKIGSGELSNRPLVEQVAATNKPVLLSSGMSSWAELDAAVSWVPGPKALFQCTSSYPVAPERLGLNLIPEMSARYGVPVGLSDHSAKLFAGISAVTLGASLVEVHVVFDRRCFGPDTSSSLTLDELASLVEGARFAFTARAYPVDKDALAAELQPMKLLFEKSIVLNEARAAGHRLEPEDLAFKKPGTGILAPQRDLVLGRALIRDVEADVPLTWEDLHDI